MRRSTPSLTLITCRCQARWTSCELNADCWLDRGAAPLSSLATHRLPLFSAPSFSIAYSEPLFAKRAASACGWVTRHQPRNTNRAISNRNRPGFRNFAIPWKQTRNDFLTATNSPMSRNPAYRTVRGWIAHFAGHRSQVAGREPRLTRHDSAATAHESRFTRAPAAGEH